MATALTQWWSQTVVRSVGVALRAVLSMATPAAARQGTVRRACLRRV